MKRPVIDRAAELDRVFDLLVAAAVKGERCPMNDTFGVGKTYIPDLAREGRLIVEVYAHNYRVVQICAGKHRGKRTAPAREGMKPYLIIDQSGSRSRRGFVLRVKASAQQPWRPGDPIPAAKE